MKNYKTYAYIAAIISAVIWGVFFLVAKTSLSYLNVPNIIALRYILASLPFWLFIFWKKEFPNKLSIKYGVLLGLILSFADFLQLTGIHLASISASALLSQGLIIFIPLILLLIGRKVAKFDFVRALVALTGVYLFTVKDVITAISIGDMFVLGFAITISLYFIINESFVTKVKLMPLLAVQFLTEGLLGVMVALISSGFKLPSGFLSWLQILYLGFLATSLAWGLNSWAQRKIKSQRIVIVYILEPLVAGLLAFLFFAEKLSTKEIVGAAVILFAIIMPIFKKEQS